MALKRSNADGDSGLSRKRACTAAQDEPAQKVESPDDESLLGSEDTVKFTDKGGRRARSEACRNWIYACEVEGCGQRFNRPCRLEAHARSHNKERPFKCPQDDCDKAFPRKDHLQRHMKSAHTDGGLERSFACDWEGCGKSFTSNGRLRRHRDVHESKFYCSEYPPCKEVFRKEKTLEAHIKSQHLEVKPFHCTYVDEETREQCRHGYQTEGALRRHICNIHSRLKDDKHYCTICMLPDTGVETVKTEDDETVQMPIELLAFDTSEELTAHIREAHPPVCSECGQQFKSASTLKSHFTTAHTENQRQYPCPRPGCDSVFNRKNNLNVHIQSVHDKQHRFFCASDAMRNSKHADLQAWDGNNACGAPFKAKSSLDQHIRTLHLGQVNRKEARKQAKSKKKPEPSMLTLLTGVGYEKGREVPCLVKGCEFRFYMDRDLRRHLRAPPHNIQGEDVEEMIRERDALSGGQFWIGGIDPNDEVPPLSMFDSVEPSMPQTPAAPYYMDDSSTNHAQMMPLPAQALSKPAKHAPPGYFSASSSFEDLDMFDVAAEEADMDAAMGLDMLPPAVDANQGLQLDMLAPVEEWNYQG